MPKCDFCETRVFNTTSREFGGYCKPCTLLIGKQYVTRRNLGTFEATVEDLHNIIDRLFTEIGSALTKSDVYPNVVFRNSLSKESQHLIWSNKYMYEKYVPNEIKKFVASLKPTERQSILRATLSLN